MSVAVTKSPRAGIYGALGRLMRRTPTQAREASWGLLFVSPWILGLLIFTVGPILFSFYISFTDYEIGVKPGWVGLDNYVRAFNLGKIIPAWSNIKGDRLTGMAIGKTLIYAAAVVPLGTMGSLLLALLLNQKLAGTYLFRALFYMPSLIPGIASVMLWKYLMHPRVGLINSLLSAIGIQGPGWLQDPKSAMLAVVIIGLWGSMGGNRMLIFLAGLQGVPRELYEASELDGAGTWHRFAHVTLPMISPTVLFNLILGVIGALQVFTIAFAGTGGGPSYATWFYALHIYRQAFEYFFMGYGAALAWIFAVGLLFFTWIQMSVSNRWVFYAGGR